MLLYSITIFAGVDSHQNLSFEGENLCLKHLNKRQPHTSIDELNKVMDIIPAKLRKLWNGLELRLLVLLSLFLQIALITLGNRRKYTNNKGVAAILWLAYLSSDFVATLALGVLSQAEGDAKVADPIYTIQAFWAPFLLMHLGGPDTITAYALADNELWSRHFLGLIVQVIVAIYVFLRSYSGTHLNMLWMVAFCGGVVKYGERTWALFSASKDRFRHSVVSPPDPGLNYAKFMDEMVSREDEGYIVSLRKAFDIPPVYQFDIKANAVPRIQESLQLQNAYGLYERFKILFADLILTSHDRETSIHFFRDLSCKDAFAIVEMELGLVYDLFYTKTPLVFSRTGIFLRIFSCSSTIAAFVAFLIIKKNGYPETEVIITYILLVGAIFLEIYAILILSLSDRMMIWLKGDRGVVRKLLSLLQYIRVVPASKRWSNSVGQYNILNDCLNYMPKRITVCWYPKKFIRCTEKYLFWRNETIQEDLKVLIIDEVRKNAADYSEKLGRYWIDKVLIFEMNYFESKYDEEVEFDRSLLLWHMATDICYHTRVVSVFEGDLKFKCESCIILSNYMAHLLIMSPFMLPSGVGQILFLQDTVAEANEFFSEKEQVSKEEACEMLSQVEAKFIPADVKGDRSKSLLFDAGRLAKSLNDLEVEERWEKITRAWMDMLTFAAAKCSWRYHAEKLSQGGELLTHVRLLMTHFGMTDQFQISKGHIRARLEFQ